MQKEIFDGKASVNVRAMFLGERLDLRAYEHMDRLSAIPLTVSAGAFGAVIMFRYGVLVFFAMQPNEILKFVEDMQSLIIDPIPEPEYEEIQLFVSPDQSEGIEQGRIRLHDLNLQRIQVVAYVLAKSVVLAHYELKLSSHFDRIEPLAVNLRDIRRPGHRFRDLLQHIGDTLMIEAKMTGRVAIVEKPDLIWDYPEYERLYLRLEDEFELAERHGVVDRKLALITKTVETSLAILQDKRTLRVEWYIVILIVIEILITLAEKI